MFHKQFHAMAKHCRRSFVARDQQGFQHVEQLAVIKWPFTGHPGVNQRTGQIAEACVDTALVNQTFEIMLKFYKCLGRGDILLFRAKSAEQQHHCVRPAFERSLHFKGAAENARNYAKRNRRGEIVDKFDLTLVEERIDGTVDGFGNRGFDSLHAWT